MGLVKGLHHVQLKCTMEEFEKAVHFYQDILGLELLSRHKDCAILDTGNGIVEIFNDADKLLGQGDLRHLAFEVEDVAKCIETVEKAGYKIKEYPVNVMFGLAKPTPATIAFCWGAAGEEVEFFQVREA